MKLKLDGKPFSVARPSPPSVIAVSTFLDKLPFGELMSSENVRVRCGIGNQTLRNYARKFLSDYNQQRHGREALWGSKRTIAEYRRQLALEAQRETD